MIWENLLCILINLLFDQFQSLTETHPKTSTYLGEHDHGISESCKFPENTEISKIRKNKLRLLPSEWHLINLET